MVPETASGKNVDDTSLTIPQGRTFSKAAIFCHEPAGFEAGCVRNCNSFFNPATGLIRGFSAAEIIAEPLVIQRRGSDAERRRSAHELTEQPGLLGDAASRLASEFSRVLGSG